MDDTPVCPGSVGGSAFPGFVGGFVGGFVTIAGGWGLFLAFLLSALSGGPIGAGSEFLGFLAAGEGSTLLVRSSLLVRLGAALRRGLSDLGTEAGSGLF